MEARAVDLPRHARARLPEPPDADRPAKRIRLDQFPRGIENGVNWCMGLLQYIWDRGYTRANATLAAQERWTAHVIKMYEIMLMRKAKGWFTGYNSNVPGHEEGTIRYFVYNGGTPKFVGIISDVAARGYEEIVFSSNAPARPDA